MTELDQDAHWMRQAIAAGAQGTRLVRPNPKVGCVIVRDGQLVGAGFHAQAGGPHAEVVALQQAGERARGGTAYVTLEPCNHFGKTRPCAPFVQTHGITRVVVGCRDPNPAATGGIAWLQQHGVAVTVGVEEAAANQLAEVFFANVARQRPFVQLKLAATLDGRTAAADGSSRWVTGPAARRQVAEMRAEADAVLIGSGTALADDPQLDLRHLDGPARLPLRVILDRRGRLHGGLRLADTTRQRTVVYRGCGARGEPAGSLADRGVDVREFDAQQDWLARVLGDLLQRDGVCHVLCEGGPTLATALIRAQLVDRLDMLVAPKLLGAGAPVVADLGIAGIGAAQQWRFDDVQRVGDDVWLVARPEPPKPME